MHVNQTHHDHSAHTWSVRRPPEAETSCVSITPQKQKGEQKGKAKPVQPELTTHGDRADFLR